MTDTKSPTLDKTANPECDISLHSDEQCAGNRSDGLYPCADMGDLQELPELQLNQYYSVPLAQLPNREAVDLCNQLFEPDERFCQGYYRYWRYILNQSKEEAWKNALEECETTLNGLIEHLDDPYMYSVGFRLDERQYVPVGIFGFRELTQHYQGKKLAQALADRNMLGHYEGKLAMAHTYSSLKKYRNLAMLKYTFLQIALNALRGGYKHIFFFMSDFRLGTIYKRFGLEFPDLSFHDSHHLVGCYTMNDEHIQTVLKAADEFGINTEGLARSLQV
ncbi:MAG: hypothetical protein KC476_02590 [Cyanobacteria bacterium HKST-UBA06]|nr:hypothetical protein [Cyanobacteria bacterium HKST-UBA06]MCA9841081.1 hypothetical protein [Cyanobacteria bacterium HKST-UBA03]